MSECKLIFSFWKRLRPHPKNIYSIDKNEIKFVLPHLFVATSKYRRTQLRPHSFVPHPVVVAFICASPMQLWPHPTVVAFICAALSCGRIHLFHCKKSGQYGQYRQDNRAFSTASNPNQYRGRGYASSVSSRGMSSFEFGPPTGSGRGGDYRGFRGGFRGGFGNRGSPSRRAGSRF